LALYKTGPAWSAQLSTPVDAGQQPLGVENATLVNAARLVPVVTAATTQARYLLLHGLLAARYPAGARTGGDLSESYQWVRRAEVVLGVVSRLHEFVDPMAHNGTIPPPPPHGYRNLGDVSGDIDVVTLARSYAVPTAGFLAAYRGSEMTLGLLENVARTLLPGEVRLAEDVLAGLVRVLDASRRDRLTHAELARLLPEGCLCAVRHGAEARLARGILFGGPEVGGSPSTVQARQYSALSGRLLLTALEGREVASTSLETAMVELCVSGDLASIPAALRLFAQRWRGALLRNANVTAWRWLWAWLTEQLPCTGSELGERLGAALDSPEGDGSVRAVLFDALPPRTRGGRLLDLEGELLFPDDRPSGEPLDLLRLLALGTLRLDDLAGTPALPAFTGKAELGPQFLRGWLGDRARLTVREFGAQLAAMLFAHAQQESWRRQRWEGGRLRLPTRLMQVGEVWYLYGEEGDQSPGLRLGSLRRMLASLDLLVARDGRYERGPAAAELGW
jgi:hypothetical protein